MPDAEMQLATGPMAKDPIQIAALVNDALGESVVEGVSLSIVWFEPISFVVLHCSRALTPGEEGQARGVILAPPPSYNRARERVTLPLDVKPEDLGYEI